MKSQKNIVLLLAALTSLTLTACNGTPASSVVPGKVETLPVVTGPTATPTPVPSVSPTATPVASATPAPSASDAKIALVYAGTGVCEEDCAEAAAESARLAGLTPKLITGTSLSDKATADEVDAFYKNVAVWIEPGGYARNSWQGMTKKMQTTLKAFVQAGGGYVGFCAGAFMATSEIGGTGASGLGIFPGKTYPYNGSTTVKVNWQGTQKTLYWEGGPYFYNLDSTVEVVGLYSNGSVAAARSQYGAGRVFLSGPHPEAPGWWYGQGPSSSVSGPTQAVAADMIKWAARLQ